jgi:prophage regulatory protein
VFNHNGVTKVQTNTEQKTSERLLRLPDVEARTGLKKSALYAGMKAGTFPTCIKLGARAVAWSESDIANWITAKIRGARGGQL